MNWENYIIETIRRQKWTSAELARRCGGKPSARTLQRWLKDPTKCTLQLRTIDALLPAIGLKLQPVAKLHKLRTKTTRTKSIAKLSEEIER